MKKMLLSLVLALMAPMAASAMSYEEAREQALFLTDKMAYELNLNDEQYEYCYEINLDYLMGVQTADDVYGGRIARSVARMEKDEQNGMSPEAAARTIVRVALQKRRVKPYYAIGFSYKFLVLLDSLLPCRPVRWLLFQLYGK